MRAISAKSIGKGVVGGKDYVLCIFSSVFNLV
jgi:hypothetical protein